MNESYLPADFDRLFSNGSKDYYYFGEEMNNIESMQWFIEEVGILENAIIKDDGTQITLQHPDYDHKLVVDAGGLGDFFSHGFEVSRLEETDDE